jgi:hypothetical protein
MAQAHGMIIVAMVCQVALNQTFATRPDGWGIFNTASGNHTRNIPNAKTAITLVAVPMSRRESIT